jgi:hypothetical protein
VFGVVLLVWGISTTWERNTKIPISDWKSDLRADAAAYAIYLPGLFRYGYHAADLDSSDLQAAGNGFIIDREGDRLRTKCLYGVALLELPFFLATDHCRAPDNDAVFTDAHRRGVEAAAVSYWVMGLVLLGFAMHRRFAPPLWAVLVTLLGISFCSNVFFYVIRQAGYSHVYAFFAVSLAIWAVVRALGRPNAKWRWAPFHLATALIMIIRPLDAIAVAGLYAWVWAEDKAALRGWRFWASQAAFGALLALPQLVYWNFAYGRWFVDSYPGEGFTHWRDPRLLEVLFAPENGMFPYAPVLLFLPAGLWALHRSSPGLAWAVLGTFVLLVYACGSWWSWSFGCSFGNRPSVQYMPFIAWPVMAFLARTEPGWVRTRFAVMPLFMLICFLMYRLSLDADPCWGDWGVWNWDRYARRFLEAFFDRIL